MDEKLRQTYLYDFYGELLNEHQRGIYERFVFCDLSLGEIAEQEGISRQGVSEVVKRCEGKLLRYEEKLHLVQKFLSVKEKAEEIRRLTKRFSGTEDRQTLEQIAAIAERIVEEL